MSKETFNNSLVVELNLMSYLTDWLVLDTKACGPSTSSNHISLSNSVENSVHIYSFSPFNAT